MPEKTTRRTTKLNEAYHSISSYYISLTLNTNLILFSILIKFVYSVAIYYNLRSNLELMLALAIDVSTHSPLMMRLIDFHGKYILYADFDILHM